MLLVSKSPPLHGCGDRTWTYDLRVMSCASKYGLDVLGTFRSFTAWCELLSRPFYPVVSIAFFRFWVSLWVRRRWEGRSADKGFMDCTTVFKERSLPAIGEYCAIHLVFTSAFSVLFLKTTWPEEALVLFCLLRHRWTLTTGAKTGSTTHFR